MDGFHDRFRSLVEQIERDIPVSDWRCGDVDLWPLARMDLFLDLYWQANGGRPERRLPRYLRQGLQALLEHRMGAATPVDAVFLGDGVSYDLVGGVWRDRYCDPLISKLEDHGRHWMLMESGEPRRRRPQQRTIHPTRMIALAGQLGARFLNTAAYLPGHDGLPAILARQGVAATSLSAERLVRRAHIVSATASVFQRVLSRRKPSLAFVVTWYAGLGPAFVLACRRQKIMSIDLQHCPQGRGHKAYHWATIPERGYTTMPAVFWNWSSSDAAAIDEWARKPWHRGFHGGQLAAAAELDDVGPEAEGRCDKEILVALQSLAGHEDTWRRLAEEIERSPAGWRWWIRRHPAAGPEQDRQYERLLNLPSTRTVTGAAVQQPLSALLQKVDAVVSLSSGTGVEGAAMGIPALFLDGEARARFRDLIAPQLMTVVEDVSRLNELLSALERPAARKAFPPAPDIARNLDCLMTMAADYKRLFNVAP